MADRTFTVLVKQVGSTVSAIVTRDSTTIPVDNTSGGKRLFFPSFRDQGYGGPGLALDGTPDGRHPVTTLTGATNAAPIVVTASDTMASLGIAAGDIVSIEDVLGNTNANGTFFVTSVSGSTATLEGSAGNAAYTSGGKMFKLNKGKGFNSVLNQVVQAIMDEKSLNG